VAVGAGRGRIVRQLLTESLMLSLAGGVLGLAAGYVGIRTILTFIPDNIPRIGLGGSNVGLDWRVLDSPWACRFWPARYSDSFPLSVRRVRT
jgi:putative ABC transport system permease protein